MSYSNASTEPTSTSSHQPSYEFLRIAKLNTTQIPTSFICIMCDSTFVDKPTWQHHVQEEHNADPRATTWTMDNPGRSTIEYKMCKGYTRHPDQRSFTE